MKLIIFYIFLVTSVVETLFRNGDQCACALVYGECTPYCICDPFCSAEQKKNFVFTLPQNPGGNQVACDTKRQIRSKNLKSISTFKPENDIEAPTCYVYAPAAAGSSDYITSFTPKDFGVTAFVNMTKKIYTPKGTDLTSRIADTDPILFMTNTSSEVVYYHFMLPSAIGSVYSNVLVPLTRTVKYANNLCVVGDFNPFSANPQTFFYIVDPTEIDVKWGELTIVLSQPGSRYNLKISPPTFAPIPIPFLGNLTNKTFQNSVILTDANIQDASSKGIGYITGFPIKIGGSPDKIKIINGFIEPVLFGIDSKFVFKFENASLTILNETINLSSVMPSTTGVPNPGDPNSGVQFQYKEFNVSTSNVCRARWTFLYQRKGSSSNFGYFIRKLITEIILPPQDANSLYKCNFGEVETKFLELNAAGDGLYTPPEDDIYSFSFQLIFDTFFQRRTDSLKAIGFFFCAGLLATIWAYTTFHFNL